METINRYNVSLTWDSRLREKEKGVRKPEAVMQW